jgi:hypothetical protein
LADLLTASRNDIATAQASHGEITALHEEVARLRLSVNDNAARLRALEPEE